MGNFFSSASPPSEQQNQQQKQQQIKEEPNSNELEGNVYMLLGLKASGKGSFVDCLQGQKVSEGSRSHLDQSNRLSIYPIYNRKLGNLIMIDSPGFYDTDPKLRNEEIEKKILQSYWKQKISYPFSSLSGLIYVVKAYSKQDYVASLRSSITQMFSQKLHDESVLKLFTFCNCIQQQDLEKLKQDAIANQENAVFWDNLIGDNNDYGSLRKGLEQLQPVEMPHLVGLQEEIKQRQQQLYDRNAEVQAFECLVDGKWVQGVNEHSSLQQLRNQEISSKEKPIPLVKAVVKKQKGSTVLDHKEEEVIKWWLMQNLVSDTKYHSIQLNNLFPAGSIDKHLIITKKNFKKKSSTVEDQAIECFERSSSINCESKLYFNKDVMKQQENSKNSVVHSQIQIDYEVEFKQLQSTGKAECRPMPMRNPVKLEDFYQEAVELVIHDRLNKIRKENKSK